MKFKFSLSIATLATVTAITAFAGSALAQTRPTGLEGHYVGGGISAGINTDEGFDDIDFGGVAQGRYQLPTAAPISLRGSVLFDSEAAAIQPMVTYDIATSDVSNVYLGGGGSFVVGDEDAGIGDRSAVLLVAGAEGAISERWALFGDVRWAINGFGDGQGVSLQTGAAFRF